jgi:PelA/Pel-15E family pectate lyase
MTRTRYEPGPLSPGTTYVWRVDELTPSGIIIGRTWRFTTEGKAGSQPGPPVEWANCLDRPAEWYRTAEAVRVGDNVLQYQRRTGGWPKNVDMAVPLSADGRARLAAEKDTTDSTIDNGATTAQIRYLALLFGAGRQERFRSGVLSGLRYLLAAQYSNGGWPQYYPLREDYSRRITFNDDAMIRVLEVLRDVAQARPPFVFVDRETRTRAAAAVDRGIQLILRAQIAVNGRRTAWCAQHDENTLEPAAARSYELASLSGRESVAIVEFLMEIERPSHDVVRAVEAAVAWFRESALTGIRLERRADPATPHGFDYVLVEDPAAPPLWARFYDIATNRPMYVGRDGVVRATFAEVEYERRTGYVYLGDFAARLLNETYPAWRKRIAAKPPQWP